MFELYRRNGHSKEKIFESDQLEDIARISAEKSGVDPDDLFELGLMDDE